MRDKIILGTAQFGTEYGINNQSGRISKKKIFEIFETAISNGINSLDTAEAYGNCYDLIKEFNTFNNFDLNLYSKLNSKKLISIKSLEDHISKSLDHLNQKYFEGYMFHSYQALKSYPHFFEDLLKIKEKGYIKNIGISLYTNDEINDVAQNYDQFDFIQSPFNLLDNEIKRKDTFTKLIEKNIKIQVRSVFLQGIFFMDSKNIPETIGPLVPYLKRLRSIAKTLNTDMETMALNYVSKKKYIDQIVIGIDNINHLKKNIKVLFNQNNFCSSEIDKISVYEEELLNPINW